MLKAETDTSTVYYTRGFELISRREGATASYYIYDGGLSVRALTNESGTVTDTVTFDAFGNETGHTGTTDNSYGFQGEEQDATGLYYLRARYMDPATGTFTTMDTYGGSLSDPMSLHKYLFANANPVRYCDPSGHASMIETGAVMGIMCILAGSADALIAEFIYKSTTDVSERSSADEDKCVVTAFATGFFSCLFGSLATLAVFVFAFTVLECLMAAAICTLIATLLGGIEHDVRQAGNEDAATVLGIAKQSFVSATIAFAICGISGGGTNKTIAFNADSKSGSPTSLYRKMSRAEYEKTIATGKLQGQVPGTDSTKWLSQSYDKVVSFQNTAVQPGTEEVIVEFQMKEEYMDYLINNSIPQANSKGLPFVKYHYEGLNPNGSIRNYGITSDELSFFNQNIVSIIER